MAWIKIAHDVPPPPGAPTPPTRITLGFNTAEVVQATPNVDDPKLIVDIVTTFGQSTVALADVKTKLNAESSLAAVGKGWISKTHAAQYDDDGTSLNVYFDGGTSASYQDTDRTAAMKALV